MLIGIDTGGTFTDLVLFDGQHVRTCKVPSTPEGFSRGVLDAIQDAQPDDSFTLVHASTVATNALLERKLARAALITTHGFRDVLEIGRQTRPELYNLATMRPPPLIPRSLRKQVRERVSATGKVLQPLNEAEVEKVMATLAKQRVDIVAVCLLFSFLHPAHEKQIAAAARRHGLKVTRSSEVLPEFREFERTSTTVVNACVSPVMQTYVKRLARNAKQTGARQLRIVQSNGGSLSVRAAGESAVHTLLSGPAAGVAGALAVAQTALETESPQVISFDMGGTSTDVALLNGDVPITTEADVAGWPVRVPMMDIHTVGAGGGSIATLDAGGALQVGPESAGADPGPACYGMGTRPTVTDANLVLGRIVPDHFLGGRKRVDREAAAEALAPLAQRMNMDIESVATAVIRIVNANMERAIRVISVERGHDPRDFTLLSYGGAGGLHVCELARSLRIPRVLIPRHPGVLSAWGALAMDVTKDYSRTVLQVDARPNDRRIERAFRQLESQARRELRKEGFPDAKIILSRSVDLRYAGQSYELPVSLPAGRFDATHRRAGEAAFHAAHEQRFGHAEPDLPVEWVTLRVRATGPVAKPQQEPIQRGGRSARGARLSKQGDVEVMERERLCAGNEWQGPVLLVEDFATTWIPSGWQVRVDKWGHLHCTEMQSA